MIAFPRYEHGCLKGPETTLWCHIFVVVSACVWSGKLCTAHPLPVYLL